MASIASTLARINSDPLACLGGKDKVNALFTQSGHVWRKCVWDPATTLGVCIVRVLNENAAMNALRHLTGIDIKDSSFCDAVMRLPARGVAEVVESVCGEFSKNNEASRSWLGHNVFVADATSATTPDQPALQTLWPQPSAQKPGCGFPAVKLLGMLDLLTGMIVHLSLMCMNVHEMSQLPAMHAMLKTGDVLLADRGFCSFWHLAMLAKSSIFAVFRMHQRQIVDFTPHRRHRAGKAKGKGKGKRGVPTSRYVKRLGHEDHLVDWARPAKKPAWMSDGEFAQMPQTVRVRELRYRIAARGRRTRVVTVATTLIDAARYPKHKIAALYGLRWEIETNFRHLKTTMKMDRLKSQTVDGVIKELMVFALVYNLIRAAMVAAAERQGVEVNRISFIDAQRWLCSILRKVATAVPIDLIVNPIREERWEPRVLKGRMKPYDLMNRPRGEYAEPSSTEEVMA